MVSISASFNAGMTGATMTAVGTPASASAFSVEPACRRGGARLHPPGKDRIEPRHGDRDLDEALPRHRLEKINVAQHQRGFGHDADRMIGARQHFEHLRASPDFALDRLIGIGIGADGDRLRLIVRRRQLALAAAPPHRA